MSMSKLQQKLYKKEKERKAAAGKKSASSAESKAKLAKDQTAFICSICRQAFPVNATVALLEQHAISKHPDKTPEELFPAIVSLREAEAKGPAKKKTGIKGKAALAAKDAHKGGGEGLPDFLVDAKSSKKKKKKKKPV
eukprot:g6295.t1